MHGPAARSEGHIDIKGISLAALIMVQLMVFASVVGMPFSIEGITRTFAVSNANAGLVATFEMGGVAVGTLGLAQIASRLNPRRIFAFGIGLIILCNAASVLAGGIHLLYVARAICGVAVGMAVAMATATAGRSSQPEKTFGVLGSAMGGLSMVMALILPQALRLHDRLPASLGLSPIDGLYLTYLLAAVIAALFVFKVPVPPKLQTAQGTDAARSSIPLMGWLSVLGFAVLSFGQATLHLFLIKIGVEQAGLSAETVGLVLMTASVLGIFAPLAAGYVGSKVDPLLPVLGILALIAVLEVALGHVATPMQFYAIVPLFAMTPLALSPLLMGAQARFDATGRLVATNSAITLIGIAFAPLVGGMISTTGNYSANGWLAAFCALVAGALVAPLLLRVSSKKLPVVEISAVQPS